jgi:hypothetical protein
VTDLDGILACLATHGVDHEPVAMPLVEAELVALGIDHHDVPLPHRRRGLVPLHPGRAEGHEPVGLPLQRRHPLVTGAARRRPDVEVQPVLGRLALGTRWKNRRGPAPSGSMTADASLRRSGGTPNASRAASQFAKPGGGAA